MEFFFFLLEASLCIGIIGLIFSLILSFINLKKSVSAALLIFNIIALLGFGASSLLFYMFALELADFKFLALLSTFVFVALLLALRLKMNSHSSIFAILSSFLLFLLLVIGIIPVLYLSGPITLINYFNGLDTISWFQVGLGLVAVLMIAFSVITHIRGQVYISKSIIIILSVVSLLLIGIGFGRDLSYLKKNIKFDLVENQLNQLPSEVMAPFYRNGDIWIASRNFSEPKKAVARPSGFFIAEAKVSPDNQSIVVINNKGSYKNGMKYSNIVIYDLNNGTKTGEINGRQDQYFKSLKWSTDNKISFLDSTKDDTIFIADKTGKILNQYKTTSKRPLIDWAGQDLIVLDSKNPLPDSSGYGNSKILIAKNANSDFKEIASIDLTYNRLPTLIVSKEMIIVKSFPDWEKPSEAGADDNRPVFKINITSGRVESMTLDTDSNTIGTISPDSQYYVWCPNVCFIVNKDKSTKIAIPDAIKIGQWINNNLVMVKNGKGVALFSITGEKYQISDNSKDDLSTSTDDWYEDQDISVPPTGKEETAAPVQSDTSEWKQYSNDRMKYQIEYPAKGLVLDLEETIKYPSAMESYANYDLVQFATDKKTYSIKAIPNIIVDSIEAWLTDSNNYEANGSDLNSYQKTSMGSKNAYKSKNGLAIYGMNKNTVYIIRANSGSALATGEDSIFDHLVNSFSLL